ncbi:MAG: hypothetical protein AABY32_04415 [Nanoarchaeota archaeon]
MLLSKKNGAPIPLSVHTEFSNFIFTTDEGKQAAIKRMAEIVKQIRSRETWYKNIMPTLHDNNIKFSVTKNMRIMERHEEHRILLIIAEKFVNILENSEQK